MCRNTTYHTPLVRVVRLPVDSFIYFLFFICLTADINSECYNSAAGEQDLHFTVLKKHNVLRPFLFCVRRFSGCVLRGAADRPSEAGVLDKTGLPGDPQRRSQEQRGSGAGQAALNTDTHT